MRGTDSGKTKNPKAKKTRVVFDNLESGAAYKVWVRAQSKASKGDRVSALVCDADMRDLIGLTIYGLCHLCRSGSAVPAALV